MRCAFVDTGRNYVTAHMQEKALRILINERDAIAWGNAPRGEGGS